MSDRHFYRSPWFITLVILLAFFAGYQSGWDNGFDTCLERLGAKNRIICKQLEQIASQETGPHPAKHQAR